MGFTYIDLEIFKTWWIVFDGKNVDINITSTPQVMVEIWAGDRALYRELYKDRIGAVGNSHLIRSIGEWFRCSAYAGIRPVEPPH